MSKPGRTNKQAAKPHRMQSSVEEVRCVLKIKGVKKVDAETGWVTEKNNFGEKSPRIMRLGAKGGSAGEHFQTITKRKKKNEACQSIRRKGGREWAE